MISVFYDGKCGVCRREMAHYRKVAPAGIFEWVDIMQEPRPALPSGLSLPLALQVLHVQDARGALHSGLDAFFVIWNSLPRYRWLYRLLRLPGVYFLARKVYELFASVRFHCMGYDRCRADRRV